MKKINLKFFIILAFIFVSLFSVFFLKIVSAQNKDFMIETTGYAVLSANNFSFGGAYSGNFDKKGFTTYFEYEKADMNTSQNIKIDSADLFKQNSGTTIEIKRPIAPKTTIDENGVFYSSPELQLFSTYYFRAVGYFNDNPSVKFYGQTLSINTGEIPIGFTSYPYIMEYFNPITWQKPAKPVLKPYTFPNCTFKQELVDGECIDVLDAVNTNPPTTTPPVSSPTSSTNTSAINQSTGGIVKCVDNCGFADFIELLNRIVKFIMFDLAVPIAAIMFAYAGFELMTSQGETSKREKAKKIFTNVAIGLILVVSSFIIIQTILSIVGYDKTWNWFGF